MTLIIYIVICLYVLTALFSAGHALISKKNPRSSLIWIIFSLILPFIGSISYYLFGINRIERKAKTLKQGSDQLSHISRNKKNNQELIGHPCNIFSTISDGIEQRPLLANNNIQLLRHGGGAYPVMLSAINHAQHFIVLSTYIFDNDFTGNQFITGLFQAQKRGVDVYVLIDGVGVLYSSPSVIKKLKKNNITCAKFLPFKLIPPSLSLNLRNHRKIMVVDNVLGFTGGLNISDRHRDLKGQQRKVSDMHFKFQGPIVGELINLFNQDWLMSTGKSLSLTTPEKLAPCTGTKTCRLIVDGPDEDLNKLSLILHSAISAAKKSVTIMTPYFIPSREMIAIMLAVANHGILVRIILPKTSNLPYVDAATRNLLWELLEWNIKIYYQPAPFEHGKLIVIDDCYVLVGSANIDPRSLRLNFELMVEIFDQNFAMDMISEVNQILQRSRQVSFEEVESRSLYRRIKDSLAWLFSPYL